MNTTQCHESGLSIEDAVGENPPLDLRTMQKIRKMTEEEKQRSKVREARNKNG